MYKISFYVPRDAVEKVKTALFETGAGAWGAYREVAWQTLGQGQFRPLKGSHPTHGETLELTFVEEYKVEMLCPQTHIQAAIATLKKTHPYEVPAFDVIALAFGPFEEECS